MLAVSWPWTDSCRARQNNLSDRLGASLCAGIGGRAATTEIEGVHFAYRPLRQTVGRIWRPAVLPDGNIVAFNGYFDNAADVAYELGADPTNHASLYGLAVQRWSNEADLRIIGEYCAVIAEPKMQRLRCSRSPLRAPPLCYHHGLDFTVVASVPRALFAAGVERRLNENRLSDSALLNFTDAEASWFEGVSRIQGGSIVQLVRGKHQTSRTYYDILAVPEVNLNSDAEYIARAKELLDQGVRACLTGFRKPGVTLSGGLDSPQVAVSALAAIPSNERLPSFTFHPEEGFDGRVESRMFGDDRPFVEAFAAMHPRLEPHFTANEGYEHDYRWNEFFHLMGGAPSGICNMYVFHGLFADAVKEGCDLLLVSDWGNDTFSNKGEWGYVEYLLKGRWRQLWLAISRPQGDERSIARRFVADCITPLLSERLWRFVRKVVFPKREPLLNRIQPLSREYRIASGAEKRRQASGVVLDRNQPRSRQHAHQLWLQRGDFEVDEGYQAFEQMYGVAQRDPTAYRPFVEFCFGLPTRMFMRDGSTRWLARQMAKGIMPEKQRLNLLYGRWDSDWHLRIGRRRHDFIAELDRIAKNDRLASMLDLPRLRAALEDWPDMTEIDRQEYVAREMAVPRGLLTARFINYVEGGNDV